jgi:hypothetical protein
MHVPFAPTVLLTLALFTSLLFATVAFASEDPQTQPLPSSAAQENGDEESAAEGSGRDVAPVAIWSVVGIIAGAIVFTALYMLKRQIGGFPENPDWVAPITILYSKDAPDEGAFGDGAAQSGAHGAQH